MAEQLEAVQPDTLVLFGSDHLNTFFLDNYADLSRLVLPPQTSGPNDSNARVPRYAVPVASSSAAQLYPSGGSGALRLAVTQEFAVDHSVLVPLHFLTPRMQIPIVPVFINGVAPPLPPARRCYALGQMVRQVVEAGRRGSKVAVLASGSFSLEVAGPRVGITDGDWMATGAAPIWAAPRRGALLEQATTERRGCG